MTTVGAYSLGSVLGNGTFATVYMATRSGSSQPFALKVLAENWSRNADVRDRFLREGRILSEIAGPGIVRVHEVAVSDAGQPFLAMDYAAQGSLDRFLGRPGVEIPCGQAVKLASAIGVAVSRAHEFNVVHRDLKPANVLIGAGYEIMVADFGLARAMSEVTRRTTIVAGTPVYMAPEQFLERADLRCDVYALGVILYELLCGRVPFAQSSYAAVLDAKRAERYPPVDSQRPDVPWQVSEVVHQSLANDPGRRQATAKEWVAALAVAGAADTVAQAPVAPPAIPPHNPVMSSPAARRIAMEQLRALAELVRIGQLSAGEFDAIKARKLADVGLIRGLSRQSVHISPRGQMMAIEQANGMRALVTDSVLTPEEYAIARQVILYDCGLGPPA